MKKIRPTTGISDSGQIFSGASPPNCLFCHFASVPIKPVKPWQKNTTDNPAIT